MRRILTILALAGMFSGLLLPSTSRAGCPPKGAACATTKVKHPPCQASERCKKHFARWDACRDKIGNKIDQCFNPTWCQKGAIYAVTPCAVPTVVTPQVIPSGQGY